MEYQKFIPEGWVANKEYFPLKKIEEAKLEGKVIQGIAYDCDNEFNIHVKLGKNIEGIIPKDEFCLLEFEEKKSGMYKNKVNDFVQFKIKDIKDENNIILSRKEVCKEAVEWIKTELNPGCIVKGIVKNIRPYGVFVEIGGGIIGFLHIQDISISRMKNPKERFFVGQKIKTMIKSIDKENSKIVLSYKELLRRLGREYKRISRKNNSKRYYKRR